jgi:hypothetical protein
MTNRIAVFIVVILVGACSSGSAKTMQPAAPPGSGGGTADVSGPSFSATSAYFVKRASFLCGDAGDGGGNYTISISDGNACKWFESHNDPCAITPNISLTIALTVLPPNPASLLAPGTYEVRPSVDAGQVATLQVASATVSSACAISIDMGVDLKTGQATWSGSVTFDQLGEDLASGSVELVDGKGRSWAGTFSAPFCAAAQTRIGDACAQKGPTYCSTGVFVCP